MAKERKDKGKNVVKAKVKSRGKVRVSEKVLLEAVGGGGVQGERRKERRGKGKGEFKKMKMKG